MSFLLPKRVKDLPPLEPDSEDDRTPAKMKNPSLRYNKSATTTFRPKRVSELSILESDSEEDKSQDNFNCAILNESFILSPMREPQSANNKPTENRRILNEVDTGYGDSFLLDFNKLNVNDSKQTNTESNPLNSNRRKPFAFLEKAKNDIIREEGLKEEGRKINKENLFGDGIDFLNENEEQKKLVHEIAKDIKKMSPIRTKSITITNSNQSEKFQNAKESHMSPAKQKDPNLHNSESNAKQHTKTKDIKPNISPKKEKQVVAKPQNENQIKKVTIVDETPCKIYDGMQFATPQVSFQVHPMRNHFGLTSTAQKKDVIENEFKLQKVLFRTPYAASRPPISSLGSNISLDLDDTVKTSTIEKPCNDNAISKPSINSENDSKTDQEQTKQETKSQQSGKTEQIMINGKAYSIIKKIGSGGSSGVFLAKLKDNDQLCALKIVDLRADASVVQGYLNETRLLAKLQGNINVVSLYEYEHLKKECKLYMVMEKGDSDLHKILQSYSSDLPLYKLVKYWYEMLQSVNYIHENGVIHSDLKPANFLVVNGRLKLIDFGIASNIAIDSTSIIKFSQAGTFNYISPEALIDISSENSPMKNNQPKIKISTKSDIWSLGCILYLLLYKKTPFGHIKNIYAKVNAITNPKTVIEYPELPMYYPLMLKDMTKKCLVHHPKERITVAELLKFPFEMLIPLRSDD